MSSDYFFDDDDFDDAALAQVEAIEAAALSKAPTPAPAPVPLPPTRPKPRSLASDSSIDITFDIDESELEKLDEVVNQQYCEKVLGVPGPSRRPIHRTSSNSLQQTTLFGDVLPSQDSGSRPKTATTPGIQRTKSANSRSMFGQQAPKTKVWDHNAFPETIPKPKKGKGKGKGKAGEEDLDEEGNECRLIPPFQPTLKLKPDLMEAKHWIFPINRPKRDYQFNIVKNCLFDNTLVALPTGLGKTFVAGVVMLNYYRWFPEGKIVFVAPTKPLVAQQIIASHETCGIPGTEAIELTGQVKSATRARYWQEKRVFYMTPQTLESDLAAGTCDPSDIILLVIDEAHHATGGYSYNQIVRFMMAKNPNFRLLALTATPGNNAESVQKLVDGLHISKIEIRSEKSLDLRKYIFEKVVHAHVIKPSGDVLVIQDLLKQVMDPIFEPLQKAGMFGQFEDTLKIHPFRPMKIYGEKRHPLAARSYSALSHLGTLARAVMYLQTGSIASCHAYLESHRAEELKKGSKNSLVHNSKFQELMKRMDEFKVKGCTPHPKMEKLKDILIKYFGSRLQEPGANGLESDDTRVMVFSSYRAVVEEIIMELNQHRPLIRAAAFVGQSKDQSGKKGLNQKEQIALVKRFQEGEFNVLVATSIGEEGLDIGEINCTVCYDTDKAPTRMIQRFGRTGRKRAGEVHALLAETREEFNLEKAKDMYQEVQSFIDRGSLYELYGDVPRLLPERVKPECVEKVMEMQHYVREEPVRRSSKAGGAGGRGTKRKRTVDPDKNVPVDMDMDLPGSFTSAGSLLKHFGKKAKKVSDILENFEELGESDDDDRDIESGNIFASVRRTQSDKPLKGKKKAGSPAPLARRSRTTAGTSKKKGETAKKKLVKKLTEMPLEELEKVGEDDEVDRELENGSVFGGLKKASEVRSRSSVASSSKRALAPEIPGATYEVSDTDEDAPPRDYRNDSEEDLDKPVWSPPPSPPRRKNGEDMGWLVDDDDEDGVVNQECDSPEPPRVPTPEFERFMIEEDSIEISQAFPSTVTPTNTNGTKPKPKPRLRIKRRSSSPEIEFVDPPVPGPSTTRSSSTARSSSSATMGFMPASKVSFAPSPEPDSPEPEPEASRSKSKPRKRKTNMSPPPVPKSPFNAGDAPTLTFPVSKPKRRRLVVIASSDGEDDDKEEEDDDDAPLKTKSHLHRRTAVVESTPAKPKASSSTSKSSKPSKSKAAKAAKISLLDKVRNPIMDGEAAHSGSDVSDGHSSSDEERSSDRDFLAADDSVDMSTQASPSHAQSYEQTQMYRQSLFTQVPMGGQAPIFQRGPLRARPFGRVEPETRGWLPSSSPPVPDPELDEYEHGSFIVPDGEEVVLDASSDDAYLDF